MSYEFYKILHFFSLIGFFAAAGCSLLLGHEQRSKGIKIATGVFTLLILVGGMGLLARLGHSHAAPMPGWVIAKVVIWFALAVFIPVASKRLPPNRRMLAFWFSLILASLAIYLAVYKPF
jgi:uncharacterized membrane protein SirB2